MKEHTFKITQTQIDTAVERDSHHCMIADSIKAKYPKLKYIHVDLQSVRFSDMESGKRYKYFTPPEAQVALLAFDHGKRKAIHPFTMKLKEGRVSNVSVVHRGGKRYPKPTTKHPHPRKYREFGLCAIKP